MISNKAKWLIKAGADTTAVSPSGLSSLQAALSYSLPDVAKILLDSHTGDLPPDTLYLAAGIKGEGTIDLIKVLIERGVDRFWMSDTGETVLTSACYAGNVEAATYLIDEVLYFLCSIF